MASIELNFHPSSPVCSKCLGTVVRKREETDKDRRTNFRLVKGSRKLIYHISHQAR